MIHYAIILTSALLVTWCFRRSASHGLAAAVFCLILLPIEIRISTPGVMPELTVHRILLLVCTFHLLGPNKPMASERLVLPGIGALVFLASMRVVSTLNGLTLSGGIKDLLSLLLESLLFYYLVGIALTDGAAVRRVVNAAALALVCIGVIGWVEKYTGVNLAARLVEDLPDHWNSVTATIRHRIQFGYAMAMGLPLLVALHAFPSSRVVRAFSMIGIVLLPAACYFGNSRGPWVGLALAGAVLAILGKGSARRKMVLLAALAGVILLLRPGVATTLSNRWEHTFDTNTLKGRSASYRTDLWKLAYGELSTSPDRFLFGFGGNSLEQMQFGDKLEFGGGSSALGYTSWDGEYAADFMKFGFVGLAGLLLLHLSLSVAVFRSWQAAQGPIRQLVAGCLAGMAVYFWAMTNVAIFNPQLTFLFWVFVAVGFRSVYVTWPAPAEVWTDADTAEPAASAEWVESARPVPGTSPVLSI